MRVKHERNRDGRFKSGVSGNPNGRPPKRISIPDLLREIGDEKIGESTKLKIALNKLFDMAIKGNIRAMELLYSRMEGRVPLGEIKMESELPRGFTTYLIGCKNCDEKAKE